MLQQFYLAKGAIKQYYKNFHQFFLYLVTLKKMLNKILLSYEWLWSYIPQNFHLYKLSHYFLFSSLNLKTISIFNLLRWYLYFHLMVFPSIHKTIIHIQHIFVYMYYTYMCTKVCLAVKILNICLKSFWCRKWKHLTIWFLDDGWNIYINRSFSWGSC